MRPGSNLIIYEEDLSRINACLKALQDNARTNAILLIDKTGQLITGAGETDGLDSTSLASLAAGNIAASGGLAQLLGEKEFSVVLHEGKQRHLHLSVVGGEIILLVLFDYRTPAGLVRLRVRKYALEIRRIFEEISRRPVDYQGEGRPLPQSIFREISDTDIENLFGRG
ncbi:MAG: roadblock/LC7 domain-containing protein [Candidatus Methylomirabilales bacterium]